MEDDEFRQGFVRMKGRYIEEVGDMASFSAKDTDPLSARHKPLRKAVFFAYSVLQHP